MPHVDPLIARYQTHLRAAGKSPRTIEDRIRVLLAAESAVRPDGTPYLPYGLIRANTQELEEWLGQDGWSTWTRCTYHQHVTQFFRWATSGERPWMDHDPSRTVPRPRNPDAMPYPVTDKELAISLERSDDWWQRIIKLAAYAGLRASEIVNLDREDVSQIRIRINLGKGGRSASVPTHHEIWRVVEPLPPGPIITPANRESLTRQMPSRARIHFDRIGLPDVHLHRFRHWYATTLLANGADIRVVQNLMRHKSLQTTAAYLALVDQRRFDAVGKLPSMTPGGATPVTPHLPPRLRRKVDRRRAALRRP